MPSIVFLPVSAAALVLLNAGCGTGEPAVAASTVPASVSDNTGAICNDWRHFEANHRDAAASIGSFHRIWADGMTELADRATDRAVAGHLRSVSRLFAVLAVASPQTSTMDEMERANPAVFAAGGAAWVALEERCGKAVIPVP